jgi:hypothetical protein
MVCTHNRAEHDSIACLQRLRNHVRRRLEISGGLQGGDEHRERDEQMISRVCYGIAKLATDPSGLSLITAELAMTDAQLSRLQAVPLMQCSRAKRMRVWESCLAATAEECSEEIAVVQQHLRPEEVTPLALVPPLMIEAFVQWPSAQPSSS